MLFSMIIWQQTPNHHFTIRNNPPIHSKCGKIAYFISNNNTAPYGRLAFGDIFYGQALKSIYFLLSSQSHLILYGSFYVVQIPDYHASEPCLASAILIFCTIITFRVHTWDRRNGKPTFPMTFLMVHVWWMGIWLQLTFCVVQWLK